MGLLVVGCKGEKTVCTTDVCEDSGYFNGKLVCKKWGKVTRPCTIYHPMWMF